MIRIVFPPSGLSVLTLAPVGVVRPFQGHFTTMEFGLRGPVELRPDSPQGARASHAPLLFDLLAQPILLFP